MNITRAAQHHEVMAFISKPKPIKVKKTDRKKLIKRLDSIVREIVLLRDGRCVICGKLDNLQCGHLITRGKHSVRWDLKNCHVQCSGCNLKHEFYPEIYTQWFLNKYGLVEYEALCRRSEGSKYSISQLEDIEFELTELRKVLAEKSVQESQ